MYMKANMKQWLLSLIILLMLPLGSYAVEGFDGPIWYDYKESFPGTGTFLDPYVISTPGQLAQLSYDVNEGITNYAGKYIVLGADIDLNKTVNGKRVQWIPIGYKMKGTVASIVEKTTFIGFFYGYDYRSMVNQGQSWSADMKHTITGMYINTTATGDVMNFGLFGCLYGLLNDIQLTDVSITVNTNSNKVVFIGGLCGRLLRDKISTMNTYDGINGSAVQGSITANANGNDVSVGGIAGYVDKYCNGIGHSTAKISIKTSGCKTVGGIVGECNNSIFDCAADVVINSSASSTCDMGGIVGLLWTGGSVEACGSMGSITFTNDINHRVGGIVGTMEEMSNVTACTSTAKLKGFGELGGIAGHMNRGSGTSKIECCAFAGHLDGSALNLDENGKAFSFDYDNHKYAQVGGLCGKMDWNDNTEHISRSLFAGTIVTQNVIRPFYDFSSLTHISATVGQGGNLNNTLGDIYYDKSLYCSNVVPGSTKHAKVHGLTTSELTAGDMNLVALLTPDQGDYGFHLKTGYYPMAFSNRPWTKYYSNSPTQKDSKGVVIERFKPENMDQTNSVHLPAAWLCAVPVNVTFGDCAEDFASTLSVPDKDVEWSGEEAGGRRVTAHTQCVFPEVDCITVDGTTAQAYTNGTFLFTVMGSVKSKDVVQDRPQPIIGDKRLNINVTIDARWNYNDPEEKPAYGKGTAEDPYIIRNPYHLKYALNHNKAGEFYKQICDIRLNQHFLTNSFLASPDYNGVEQWVANDDLKALQWKANYDGGGHFIHGMVLEANSRDKDHRSYYGLFEDITSTGSVNSLGIIGSSVVSLQEEEPNVFYGFIAGRVAGKVKDCIVQGVLRSFSPSGGICGFVDEGGVVEDCIAAVFPFASEIKNVFTPFVSFNNNRNKGTVQHCLSVMPNIFTDSRYSTDNLSSVKDCYWLKGYESGNNGTTLDKIGEALSKRRQWTWEKEYFPMLKTFAKTDMAKLLMIPVRSDRNYEFTNGSSLNFILAFGRHLEYTPGTIEWTYTGSYYVEVDNELGIIAPLRTMTSQPYYPDLYPMAYLSAKLGRYYSFIPLRTSNLSVQKGITFADDQARQACLEAFDMNKDGHLSLQELRNVTDEQTKTAFQTATARQIRQFPEFRFFKSVKTLTSQLRNMSALENVSLPYGLTTLGSEAFSGCSNLKEITLPSKLSTLESRAFYGSAVENIFVDPFNSSFVSRDGIVFTAKNKLVAYPNGKSGEEIVLPGVISEIAPGAVHKVPGMKRVYFDTDDAYTIPVMDHEGIATEDGTLPDVYVSDATHDATLYEDIVGHKSWAAYVSANKLHRYFPLRIADAVTSTFDNDGSKRYIGSMYIGFDAQLPAGLTPYTVRAADEVNYKAYLQARPSAVPALAPVLIFADQPGLYRLYPAANELESWPVSENRLEGVRRSGMELNQMHSAQGSIHTPQMNAEGEMYFHHEKENLIEAYHAYLPYNTVGQDAAVAANAHYDVVSALRSGGEITVDDLTFQVGLLRNNDGSEDALARLLRNGKKEGNVTVPSYIEATVDGKMKELDVTQIDKNAFRDASPWSIDLSECSMLEPLVVNRSAKGNPFQFVSDKTIVYLPDDMGHVAAEGEPNVVVGMDCEQLNLTDGYDFVPPYEFNAAKVNYDRKFSATKNADGTWTSRAYTICLPYDLDLTEVHDSGRIRVCKLWFVKDDKEFVFSNTLPDMKAGQAYLIVVNEGELSLEASEASVITEAGEGEDVFTWDTDNPSLGLWRGSFKKIGNADASVMFAYSLQDNGDFRRISAEAPQASWEAFRAMFCAKAFTGNNTYKSEFKQYVQGLNDDDPFIDFPAGEFVGDTDIPDSSVGIMHVINDDGSHTYFDLQGRQLPGNPNKKGVYINNGKVVINR